MNSNLYNILSDPAWSSIGVILSSVGVFVGAWFGARFGYTRSIKLQKIQLKEMSEVFKISLITEMLQNKVVINNMMNLLKRNPPIENALDVLDVGGKSLKSEVWNEMLTNQSAFLLKKELIPKFQKLDKSIKNLSVKVQMEVAEWKRALAFNDYYRRNKDSYEGMQLVEPGDILNTKVKTISEDLREVFDYIELIRESLD